MSFIKLTNEAYKERIPINSEERIRDIPEITDLIAAKNDTASFQIIFSPGEYCRVNVGRDASLSNYLQFPRYRIELVSNFESELILEGFLPDENDNLHADILLNDRAIEIRDQKNVPIWVDINIPKDADEGKYAVAVRLYKSVGAADEELIEEVPITLTIKNYLMPDSKDYKFYLDLWQHNSNIARYYDVELWGDKHFEIMENVIASLAELGQKSLMVLASDCPWRGWGCFVSPGESSTILYEYSMIKIDKKKNGNFVYDFSIMQRYIDMCEKHGITGDISVYGLIGVWDYDFMDIGDKKIEGCPEKLLIRYLDEKDGCYRYLNNREDIYNYLKALFRYFEETNQISKVRIAADEPSDMKKFQASVDFLLEANPNIKFKMAINKAKIIKENSSLATDIVSDFICNCLEGEFLLNHRRENTEKKLMFYVCNHPDKPNTYLTSELVEARLLGTLTHFFGHDGFLRWAYTCWTGDPRKDIRYGTQYMPVGDINFIYPAKDGGIELSLRWKALKRGIEDFELLTRLKEIGKEEVVNDAISMVLKNKCQQSYIVPGTKNTIDNIYSNNYEDYSAMRKLLLEELENC